MMNWKFLLGASLLGGVLYKNRRVAPVDLRDRVVIITGASSGIGQAAAEAFSRAGACVVLVARRAALLEEIRDNLQRHGGKALALPTDITQPEAVDALIRTVQQTFGRIDILVNNAGYLVVDPLERMTPENIRQSVEINLFGTMLITRAALPVMQAQRGGHIINISSVAGKIHVPGEAIYAATKAGMNAFSDALRLETRASGIHVSSVMPGWTVTPMIPNINRAEMRAIGLLDPFFPIDDAAQVASVIVEAARFRRREVILGGAIIRMLIGLQRFSPGMADDILGLYLRFTGVERFIRVMRNMQ